MYYMEKKIMSRLAILAKYKKESNDIERGATMFGKTCHQKASADFLKLLLLFIQQWASRFPMYSQAMGNLAGKQTELAKIYQSLVKEKVTFHTQEQVNQTLGQDYHQTHETVVSSYNPTSTAPQSLNHSAYAIGTSSNIGSRPSNVRPDLNMSTISNQTRHQQNSQLDQSVRKSINASQIMSNTPLDQTNISINVGASTSNRGDAKQLSKEQQMQIANQIRADYKKLGEHQQTVKLVQEVLSMQDDEDGQLDKELLNSFREQLMEGKEFSEKFLKSIIETPFVIKDKDSKIEKILGIIGELDQQISLINALSPPQLKQKVREETKRGSITQQIQSPQNELFDSQKQSDRRMSKNLGQNTQTNEIKGILKTNKFQSHNGATQIPVPQKNENNPAMFPDFKFDQNAFKTNFAINQNTDLMNQSHLNPQTDSIFGDSQKWNSGFGANQIVGQQPQQNFVDFMNFNQNSAPQQKFEAFDFGAGFVQEQNLKSQNTQQEMFNWSSPQDIQQIIKKQKNDTPKQSFTFTNDQGFEEAQQQVKPRMSIAQASQQVLPRMSETAIHSNRFSQVNEIQRKRSSSHKSHRSSARSRDREDSRSVRGKILNQVPQIEQRSPDSNPISDGEDAAQLSSSGEKEMFKVPQSINESQILRQSLASHRVSQVFGEVSNKNDFDFGFGATGQQNFGQSPFAENGSKSNKSNPQQNNHQKQNFEKFDFSEIQVTQRSSNKAASSRKASIVLAEDKPSSQPDALLVPQLQNKIKQLEDHITDINSSNELMNKELMQLRMIEIKYEELNFKLVSFEEQTNNALQKAEDYKRLAEKLEAKLNKLMKEHEVSQQREAELEALLSSSEKDLENLRQSEANAKRQLQNELIEAKKNEEEYRVKLQFEESEFKKREAFMREQWLQDLKDKEKNDEEMEAKIEELQGEVIMNKQTIQEKNEEIQKLKQQMENKILKVSQEKDREIESLKSLLMKKDEEVEALKRLRAADAEALNAQNQQKLVIKTKQIKFNKDSPVVENLKIVSSQHKEAEPSPPSQPEQEKHEDPFKFDFPQPDFKINHQQNTEQDPFKFEENKQVPEFEPMKFDPTETLNLVQPTVESNLVKDLPIEQKPTSQQVYEETIIDDIPSGDSDHDSESPKSLKKQINEKSSPLLQEVTPEQKQESPKQKISPPKDPFDFASIAPIDDQQQQVKKENPFDFAALEENHQSDDEEEKTELRINSNSQTVEPVKEELQSPVHQEKVQKQEENPFSLFNNPLPTQMKTPVKIETQFQPVPTFQQEDRKSLPKSPPTTFNVDELLVGIVENNKPQQQYQPPIPAPLLQQTQPSPLQQQPQRKQSNDPFANLTQRQSTIQASPDPFKTAQPMMMQSPQQNQTIDKSLFVTHNTESHALRQNEQQLQQQINPMAAVQAQLLAFFRKSLQGNKAVLYEDAHLQIGLVADYGQPSLVRMRLFFGNKNFTPGVQQIDFQPVSKATQGYTLTQSRMAIPTLNQGQQEPVDVNFTILSHVMQPIPLFTLSYLASGQKVQIPIRFPVTLLKLCSGQVPRVENAEGYSGLWREYGEGSEVKQQFNIDFNQCRSLTQLKETLKMGKNAFTFVDGVEQQKNIVCGATMFIGGNGSKIALLKITLTVDGHNCQVLARTNTLEDQTFVRCVIQNVLEMIALPKIAGAPQTPISK